MMADPGPYLSPGAVLAGIKDAAVKASRDDPSLTVTQRIRVEHFRRLLSRVFSDGQSSDWVLKGGTGLLARIPATRATLDIDLYRSGFTLDEALDELRRLVGVDLGDYFRFVYRGHSPSVNGALQPYVDAYRVQFDVYVGAQSHGSITVDLATGGGLTAEVTTVEPIGRLHLPRLVSHPYRLYPLVDQIADKVCAVHETHNGQPSSREKDLVDLAVIALTQRVALHPLALAIRTETKRRHMAPIAAFTAPSAWGRGYARLARPIPVLAEYPTATQAADLVSRFLRPVFDAAQPPHTWSPQQQQWDADEQAGD